MYTVVSFGNHDAYKDALSSWYKLRHRVYVEEQGWSDVARDDQLECDQFDTERTTHLLNICEKSGDVVAGARINSSLGPTLTADVFPQLCNLETLPRGPLVADGTRFCIAKERRDGTGFCIEAKELYCAIIEYCVDEGLDELIFVAETFWLQRFANVGWQLRVLGTPQPIDGRPTVAAAIKIDAETLDRTRRVVGINYSTITTDPNRIPLRDVYERSYDVR